MKKFRNKKRDMGARKKPAFTLTGDDLEYVKLGISQKMSQTDMAKALGISIPTLKAAMDKAGLIPNSASDVQRIEMTPDMEEFVYEALLDKKSLLEIADEVGLTVKTLKNRCKEIPRLAGLLPRQGRFGEPLDEKQLATLDKFASHVTQNQMAFLVKRTPTRFREMLEKDEELSERYELAKTMHRAKGSIKLDELIDEGNLNAIKYSENTRHNIVPTTKVDQSINGDVTLDILSIFQKSAEMSPEQREKRIKELRESEE